MQLRCLPCWIITVTLLLVDRGVVGPGGLAGEVDYDDDEETIANNFWIG